MSESKIGRSGHPERDIKTNRWVSSVIVLAGILGGAWLAYTGDSIAALALTGTCLATGNALKLQATEWELELQLERAGGDGR